MTPTQLLPQTQPQPLPLPAQVAFAAPPRRLASARPADDLADVRAELARLRSREQALVDLLLARPELREAGQNCRVELDFVEEPLLRTEALPSDLQNNPALWRKVLRPVLSCHPARPLAEPRRPGWPMQRSGGSARGH